MIEGTPLFNQQHYARLETLITDDAQLMELSPVAPDDDFVMELLWNAQMGNTNYPFESQATRAKQVPRYSLTPELSPWNRHCRHSA